VSDFTGKPTKLGDALKSYLKDSGLEVRVERAQVLVDWAAMVGAQIAEVTAPRQVTEDGTLFVGVKTSGWMQELSLMERSLLAKINAVPGRQPIVRIRWELMR
jgi:predicted nucleic acid-binding Zn ribbon protein